MTLRIIARLDIKGNQLCKGIHLEGLRYLGPAAQFSEFYYNQGVDELLYMDAVASLYQRNSLADIIKETAQNIFVPLTVGGGIRTLKDIENILTAGADKVALNSEAVKNPKFLQDAIKHFGASTIVSSIVTKKKADGTHTCFIHNARDDAEKDAIEWVKEVNNMGVGEVLLTSIDQEGTGKGFDYSLAQKAIEVTNVPFVISGGGGALEHIKKVAQIGVSGLTLSAMVHYDAVQNFEETTDNIADFKIIGERKIVKNFQTTNIFEIKEYLNQNNIRCRL